MQGVVSVPGAVLFPPLILWQLKYAVDAEIEETHYGWFLETGV